LRRLLEQDDGSRAIPAVHPPRDESFRRDVGVPSAQRQPGFPEIGIEANRRIEPLADSPRETLAERGEGANALSVAADGMGSLIMGFGIRRICANGLVAHLDRAVDKLLPLVIGREVVGVYRERLRRERVAVGGPKRLGELRRLEKAAFRVRGSGVFEGLRAGVGRQEHEAAQRRASENGHPGLQGFGSQDRVAGCPSGVGPRPGCAPRIKPPR